MRHSCGKLVQKSVENYVKKCVQKLCKLIVQKAEVWNSEMSFSHRMPKIHTSAKVLQDFMNKFHTFKNCYFNLL